MTAEPRPLFPTEGLRQWVLFARLGGEITARSAAARLSILEKADQRGEDAPDVRQWGADQVNE